MCLTCTLVVISMGYVLSVIQTFLAPVVSSTNLVPISFSIPWVFSPSSSIPMCTLRVQFHSHLLRKNVWSNLFVCSMAMNNKSLNCNPQVCARRLESTGDGGTKTLVPIRPIACNSGVVDIGEAIIRLMWSCNCSAGCNWFWEITSWGAVWWF